MNIKGSKENLKHLIKNNIKFYKDDSYTFADVLVINK